MTCKCSTLRDDGKATVDLIRSKGKENTILDEEKLVKCSCGTEFKMKKVITNCPNCNMTYALPPCGQDIPDNIREAGINY